MQASLVSRTTVKRMTANVNFSVIHMATFRSLLFLNVYLHAFIFYEVLYPVSNVQVAVFVIITKVTWKL